MKYDLTKPCKTCPFLKDAGIRLREVRIREIAKGVTTNPGATFACHNTVDYDAVREEEEEGVRGHISGENEKHCAGALLFAKKQGLLGFPQMQRLAMRLRMFDPNDLTEEEQAKVWDDTSQWVAKGSSK
jgi:hypothetical protein